MEHVRAFIMKQAKKAEERKQSPGTFVNFVLLQEAKWNKGQFIRLLQEEWGVVDESSKEEKGEDQPDIYVFSYKGAMCAVSMMPAPVPNGEAEYYAQNNYRWRDAVETTKKHTAQLMVSVLGQAVIHKKQQSCW